MIYNQLWLYGLGVYKHDFGKYKQTNDLIRTKLNFQQVSENMKFYTLLSTQYRTYAINTITSR